jgi:organic radical activating enzyme
MKNTVSQIDFHITNVCNFNCTDCSNFNDYYFSGQQKWEDHKDVYKKWGELVEINHISILGGEPLLNPTVLEWIDGIAEIWTKPDIVITTNGSRLNQVKDLYSTIVKYNGRVHIGIALHNIDRKDEVIADSKEFLQEIALEEYNTSSDPVDLPRWKKIYNEIRSNDWPDCDTPEEYANLPALVRFECENRFNISGPIFIDSFYKTKLQDINGIKIEISTARVFDNHALIRNDDVFTLHDSDPAKAHNKCFLKHCYFFKKGKLYQCPVVAHLSEFQEQFYLDVTDEDKDIILNGYDALTIDHSAEEREQFINTLGKQVPACKFCPEKPIETRLSASTDKIRVKKKKP